MRLSASGLTPQPEEGGEKKCLNSELWHACAGPLVALPTMGSRVVYFPQGHSEQVAASTNKEVDSQMPNYPGLPPQLICQLHNVTMHADLETEEVYAQMTLQPLSPEEQKDVCLLPTDLGCPSKQPTNYFCKTLTASDTSTHGGFSVPRRSAEKVFPPLDYSQQPPAQELIAKDLHGNEWKFRHIFRGQPKRHLLTTGWSVFVSAKRLVAGDSVIFIWNGNNQLLLGIRHATRPPTVMPSSVLSSDSMHIGLLAAAAHAAATSSRFTIFYNPRACPSEFVIPLAKYAKAVYHTRVSVGMRFRMLFETEESSVRRYMGTITGIGDLDPARWPNSHWRSVKVGWDESTAGERQPRVSLWEIEPLTTFPMYPSPYSLRLKRPWPSGLPSFPGLINGEAALNSQLSWLRGNIGDQGIQSINFQGFGATPWMQQRLDASALLGLQPDTHQAMAGVALQDTRSLDPSKRSRQSLVPFQHNFSRGSDYLQNQMLQRSVAQPNFVQSFPESKVPSHPQMLQHCLERRLSPCDQQLRQRLSEFQQPQLAKATSNLPQVESTTQLQSSPLLANLASSPLLTNLASSFQDQAFADFPGNHATATNNSSMLSLLNSFPLEGVSQLANFGGVSNLVTPASSNRNEPDSQICIRTAESGVSQANTMAATPIQKISELTSMLPRVGEFSQFQFQGIDPRSSSLFGFEPNYSNVLENGISALITGGGESGLLSMPFDLSTYVNSGGLDFAHSSVMTPSSCVDESGFIQSSENVDQVNSSNTFVKVHKAGSYGRSVDLSKYSSYHELRSDLASMFGLEGLLEDPQRSGWQLVFIDRENDVLLLGDDPWQEFVNSVWYIKILSPLEVQQMGKDDLDLLTCVSTDRIPTMRIPDGISGWGDGYVSQNDNSKNSLKEIPLVGSLDY